MEPLHQPIFCLTSDVDWASDYAIANLLAMAGERDIRPTIFATHPSEVLTAAHASGAIDLGIHPNFLPGSTHGPDPVAVLEHMCRAFPMARSSRSHSFVDSTFITRELARRGFTHDSNLCLYLQPGLMPLRHESGLVRMPVFWEDDTHWTRSPGCWDLERYLPAFLSPGLKVLNVHPFMLAANIHDQQHYADVHAWITDLDADSVPRVRHRGAGVQTFVTDLLDVLAERGERFWTLQELVEMLSVEELVGDRDGTEGRQSVHTDEEYQRYWSAEPAERQQLLKESYGQRDAMDIYATSRDRGVRELEIQAIREQIDGKGRIIDLGCGNGYSLLSLARHLEGWDLVGVDFSEPLIDGAVQLRGRWSDDLLSQPEFLCADAVAYIRDCPSESARYVITERFLLNLPTPGMQREVIEEAHRVLVPGGRLLLCEGSQNGFDALNDIRAGVGLEVIPATSKDNISSIRFKDEELEQLAVDEVGYEAVAKLGFSTYFLMTRVLHPLLAAPLPPRFDAPLNGLAARIQTSIAAEPGVGANVLWVFEKRGGRP
jgi:SAM-dependent methyltransferase